MFYITRTSVNSIGDGTEPTPTHRISIGLEARQLITVARTNWTVCYKVHAIPSRRTEYKSSITLWPRTKKHLVSRAQLGWHAGLVKTNWYRTCRERLRRHGYHGRWRWSPWGRFGDFWKSLDDFNTLATEARVLDQLRKEPLFYATRPRTRLTFTVSERRAIPHATLRAPQRDRRDADGHRPKPGDRVRVLGVPNLSGMAKHPRVNRPGFPGGSRP